MWFKWVKKEVHLRSRNCLKITQYSFRRPFSFSALDISRSSLTSLLGETKHWGTLKGIMKYVSNFLRFLSFAGSRRSPLAPAQRWQPQSPLRMCGRWRCKGALLQKDSDSRQLWQGTPSAILGEFLVFVAPFNVCGGFLLRAGFVLLLPMFILLRE